VSGKLRERGQKAEWQDAQRKRLSPPSSVSGWPLKRKEQYVELGFDYFDKKNPDTLRRSLVRRLERLGNKVILEPAVHVA
jgi:hypothetical protein